jgi:hypothetical protein
MERDDIKRLVKQVGAIRNWAGETCFTEKQLQKLISLIQSEQKETDAAICRAGVPSHFGLEWREATGNECADAIMRAE